MPLAASAAPAMAALYPACGGAATVERALKKGGKGF
jgi:hypothetical protein